MTHDTSLTLQPGLLYGFLLVLARVAGALSFVPLPGLRSAPESARAAFSVAFALALYSRWPTIDAAAVTPVKLVGWAIAEAAVGIAIGVAMAIALEAFGLAAQLLGLQAGYSYASTIDPSTEADSGILVVFAQLVSGMLFFAAGLDREVLRLFARSLDAIPPGGARFPALATQPIIRLGASLFEVGVRLALPIIGMLVMLDVALALLGRLNQQLQLLSLAFPIKMLTALLALSWIAALLPRVLLTFAGQAFGAALRTLGL